MINALQANFQSGCLSMARGDYLTALSYFLQIEKNYPLHPETQTNLGTCYLKLNQLAEAQLHYLKALLSLPNDTQLLFNLGVINMKEGRRREAIAFYSHVVEIEPCHFAAHNNLGVVWLALENAETALLHFRRAHEIDSSNLAVSHTIDLLERKKGIKQPPKEYVSSLFDSYATYYEQHLINTLNYTVPQAMFDLISASTVLPVGEWVIADIGCGTGLCGSLFREAATSLVGIDLSSGMLAEADKKGVYDELIKSDVKDYLQKYPSTFDLILASDVLVYMGDLNEIMSAASQALRWKGRFVFSTEISQVEDYILEKSGRFAHHKSYIEKLARQHRFQVMDCHKTALRAQRQLTVPGYLYQLVLF